ncbi:MAG: alanine--tRNA ligase [Chloroflexota bacterium]
MKPVTSTEIRQAFLDFFQEMGHTVVASSPLPLHDNPTLLFTNAGMNQFVNTFLGREERPYKRAVSSQKCMRVQGKHNDLENVGPSPRHHTFFEMLGNFSFGDYFKAGAIRYAYDFMTQVCQIPADRLWFTVHTNDDDAYRIWVEDVGVAAGRVLRMGDKTNFWMMGEVGPCGPTSEIHYDWGPDACTCGRPDCSVLLDNGCDRWLEVWNLVFMQFNQAEDGRRTPLPRPGVDTGMGLERITSIAQQQPVNYRTDLFAGVMERVQALLGDDEAERQSHEVGYRVIADHGRAATFLIGDGVLPGNVGAGYVLRMIIRRAARYGRNIGFDKPFLAEVAQVILNQMADVYPELRVRREFIRHTLTQEEERFARTLDAALTYLDHTLNLLHHASQHVVPGDIAFNLYATHGLPLEITRDVAGERGFTVDEAGYQKAREAHAQASGAGAFGEYDVKDQVYARLLADLIAGGRLDSSGVDYDPYSGFTLDSEILAVLHNGQRVDKLAADGREQGLVEVVTAATPFYVEAGGEVSDTGRLFVTENDAEFQVSDVRKPVPGLVVHSGRLLRGELADGQTVRLEVDNDRRWDIRRNHTATHLLHRELREHLGRHVTQAGSLVAPDRLRFDFNYGRAVDDATLARIEMAINQAILNNLLVKIEHTAQREAISAGAMALFGEKYGEVVRTIKIGDTRQPYSFELCGGLHVQETGQIGLFRFTSEGAVAAGVRRVEAVTGRGAFALVAERLDTLDRLARKLNSPAAEVETRLDSLLAENRRLERELEQAQRRLARHQFEALLTQTQEVRGIPLLAAVVEAAGMDGLREMTDWFRDKVGSGVVVLATIKDERPMIIAAVTEDLVKRGIRANDLVRQVAPIVGGSGGGRPALAQAGGKDASKVAEALAAVPLLIESLVS